MLFFSFGVFLRGSQHLLTFSFNLQIRAGVTWTPSFSPPLARVPHLNSFLSDPPWFIRKCVPAPLAKLPLPVTEGPGFLWLQLSTS